MENEMVYLSQIVIMNKGDRHVGDLAHKVLYGKIDFELPKIPRSFNLFVKKNNKLLPFFGTNNGDEIRKVVLEEVMKGTPIGEFLLVSDGSIN